MIFWTGIFLAQTRFWSKREYPPLIGNFESRFVEVILLVVGNQSSPLWSTFGCGKTKLWGLFLYVIFGLLWMVWSWLTMHTNYPPVLLSCLLTPGSFLSERYWYQCLPFLTIYFLILGLPHLVTGCQADFQITCHFGDLFWLKLCDGFCFLLKCAVYKASAWRLFIINLLLQYWKV